MNNLRAKCSSWCTVFANGIFLFNYFWGKPRTGAQTLNSPTTSELLEVPSLLRHALGQSRAWVVSLVGCLYMPRHLPTGYLPRDPLHSFRALLEEFSRILVNTLDATFCAECSVADLP